MSATPSAGALRAACNIYGRTDSLYMSERECALVIHDAIQADTAALVDAVKKFLSASPSLPVCYDFHHIKSERHEIGEPCPPKERYFVALTALHNALAKHGKGAG